MILPDAHEQRYDRSHISAAPTPMPDIFETLAAHPATRRKLAAGEMLFRAGERVKALYVVVTGRLQLVRTSTAGSAVTLHRAGDGEAFAEPSLFSERYHCDAVAEVPSEVIAYAKADIIGGLEHDSKRMMLLLRHLAGQVQALRARAEILSLRTAPERLIAYFRLQMPSGEVGVNVKGTWKQAAAELGLTHEALYRALARLEREGLITREGRKVTLRGSSAEIQKNS